MRDPREDEGAQTLSVRDMQNWLLEQTRDSAKAHELRIKEAAEFVNQYAAGKLTTEQMEQRLLQYDLRWGEPLPGTSAAPGISDVEILERMDSSRREHNARRRGTRDAPHSR